MGVFYRIVRFAVLVGLVVLVVQPAQAQITLIGNLDGNDGSQTADINDLRVKAVGFTMPAGDDYYLDYCTLRLETFGANTTVTVELWSDSGGQLGTLIETLSNPSFASSGIANYDFTSSGTTLTAGSSYWVYIYGTANGTQVDWKASSPGQTPTGTATHIGYLWSSSGPPPSSSSSIMNSYSCTASTSIPVGLETFTVD